MHWKISSGKCRPFCLGLNVLNVFVPESVNEVGVCITIAVLFVGWGWGSLDVYVHGPLTRYVKLRDAHAPGMPGTFHPPPTSKEIASYRPRRASRHVRDSRAVMGVGIDKPRWRGKRSQHSRRMRNPQFYVSGKRPITSQEMCTRLALCWVLSCFDIGRLYPYPSGLLHWHWGYTIAPVPVKQPSRICVNTPYKSAMNYDLIKTKQITNSCVNV